jgi:hypothetical protein
MGRRRHILQALYVLLNKLGSSADLRGGRLGAVIHRPPRNGRNAPLAMYGAHHLSCQTCLSRPPRPETGLTKALQVSD